MQHALHRLLYAVSQSQYATVFGAKFATLLLPHKLVLATMALASFTSGELEAIDEISSFRAGDASPLYRTYWSANP